jgi:hypothetical protein
MTEKRKKIKLIRDYRMLRYKLNLNQTEFWGRIGANQTSGCRYENGRKVPKATAVLAHLIYVMGMDIDARDYK